MTHQQNGLLAGLALCLMSSFASAAAPAEVKAPAAPDAKAVATPAAPAEAAPAPQQKRARGGSDARKCLQQPDNKGVRRCAEKFR